MPVTVLFLTFLSLSVTWFQELSTQKNRQYKDLNLVRCFSIPSLWICSCGLILPKLQMRDFTKCFLWSKLFMLSTDKETASAWYKRPVVTAADTAMQRDSFHLWTKYLRECLMKPLYSFKVCLRPFLWYAIIKCKLVHKHIFSDLTRADLLDKECVI